MERDIQTNLNAWKEDPGRMPLLVRGARQVGKTYSIEQFGKQAFDQIITINFEQSPHYCRAFDDLNPQTILSQLELLAERTITAGSTLLFLDEIQSCPQAIMALRYFKEQMPQLHVIGAGSLLEFALNDPDFRMPVGRVQFLFMQPLSFPEFLTALGHDRLRQYLTTCTLKDPVPSHIHDKCLGLVREYCAVGGMPAVINAYRRTRSLTRCQEIQSDLLVSYRSDFGKYSSSIQHKYLQLLFDRAPGLIAQWFKYTKVDPDTGSRELKRALFQLRDAGLVQLVHATKANGLPLAATLNERKFKLLFLDIGLAARASSLDLKLLTQNDLILVNRGALAEQYVGQQLLSAGSPRKPHRLYFWVREKVGSSAEIDFVTSMGAQIVPIEVKAGATGRLKSLRLFMQERGYARGVRVSAAPLAEEKGIFSIPFYLVHELGRLLG